MNLVGAVGWCILGNDMEQNCVFCKISQGELPSKKEYEDEEILVFQDIHPKAPIHLLIIPKQHIDQFLNVDPELWEKMSQKAKDLIKKFDLEPKGYRLVSNGTKAALIQHLHIHLLGDISHERDI